MDRLSQEAAARERALNNYIIDATGAVIDSGQTQATFKYTARWTKHDAYLRGDTTQVVNVSKTDRESSDLRIGYNGRLGWSYSHLKGEGRIFKDIVDTRSDDSYCYPNDIIADVAGADEVPISLLLSQGSYGSGRSPQQISIQAAIQGGQQLKQMYVVLVEARGVINGSPDGQVWRLFLARQHGYAPLRVDMLQGQKLLARTLYREYIRQQGVDLPSEVEYQVFLGDPSPRQRTVYKFDYVKWPTTFDLTEFNPAFPPGTHVFDRILGIDYIAGGADMPSRAQVLEFARQKNQAIAERAAKEGSSASAGAMEVNKANVPSVATAEPNLPKRFGVALIVVSAIVVAASLIALKWKKKHRPE